MYTAIIDIVLITHLLCDLQLCFLTINCAVAHKNILFNVIV